MIPSPPETFTLEAQRTVHGIVYKRGRVDGDPVAFARQRSTYFHEADSARAFSDLNRPSKVQNVAGLPARDVQDQLHLQLVLRRRPATSATSTRATTRCARRAPTPTCPTGAPASTTGRASRPHFKTADYTPFAEHPQVVNQPYITSWNNKQAPGYDAADDNYAYGPVHRSQSLDEQIQQRLGGSDKMSLPELIDSMEVAGNVDLRATQVLSADAAGRRHAERPAAGRGGQIAPGLGRRRRAAA